MKESVLWEEVPSRLKKMRMKKTYLPAYCVGGGKWEVVVAVDG